MLTFVAGAVLLASMALFAARPKKPKKHARSFHFNVGPSRAKRGATMALDITMDATQEVDFTAIPVDAQGNEVPSEEPVSFTVTSGDVTLVSLSPTSVTIRSGAVGDSVVTLATPDGDPSDTVTVHVIAPQAVRFNETVSPPRTKA